MGIITIYRGGQKSFDLAIAKPSGATATLSAATLKIAPRVGATASHTLTMTITDAVLWTVTRTMTAAETDTLPAQNHQYAVFATFSDSATEVVDEGTLAVKDTPR